MKLSIQLEGRGKKLHSPPLSHTTMCSLRHYQCTQKLTRPSSSRIPPPTPLLLVPSDKFWRHPAHFWWRREGRRRRGQLSLGYIRQRRGRPTDTLSKAINSRPSVSLSTLVPSSSCSNARKEEKIAGGLLKVGPFPGAVEW